VNAPIIRRGFVDVGDGQVHYRTARPPADPAGGIPLVMLHPSPGSSKMLEPLIRLFARTRRVIAPDTLGNGDSMAPAGPPNHDPPLAMFVEGHQRALDALGIARFDLYGSHTGGNIASEIAIAWPGRVRRLILDGMSLYADDERADMLRHYALPIAPDEYGSQFGRVWTFVRDAYLFWPWYKRDAAHRRDVGLPSADALHDKAVEVLKAVRTYHFSYRAAIAYDKRPRLPLIETPTLLACARNDMLLRYLDGVRALMPRAEAVLTPGMATEADAAETARAMTEFLDRAG
jgi:pimeloyl-ACP methyl ester carboxylesterase